MAKISDRDRILRLLGPEFSMSNHKVKEELNLSDERYAVVKDELIAKGLVERRKGQGGSIQLTPKGEKEVGATAGVSSFVKESDIYEPTCAFLRKLGKENEELEVVVNTSRLRSPGKWRNPDITRITIDVFPRLQRLSVSVWTFEVKQWGRWNVQSVFEAASHRRFSHWPYLALEWDKDVAFSVTDSEFGIGRIAVECQRLGVLLATVEKHYSGVTLTDRSEAPRHEATSEDVEQWLDYVLSRDSEAAERYASSMKRANERLRDGLT